MSLIHLQQILYNVTGGRDWRFKICYYTYQQLAPKTMLTNEHMLRVALMGYLLEQVSTPLELKIDILSRSFISCRYYPLTLYWMI